MMRPREKQNSLPMLSYKSSFIILASILIGTIFFPFVLDQLGLQMIWLRVIIATVFTTYTTTFCLYFVDTKRGFVPSFWVTFAALSAVIGFITIFWMYDIIHI